MLTRYENNSKHQVPIRVANVFFKYFCTCKTLKFLTNYSSFNTFTSLTLFILLPWPTATHSILEGELFTPFTPLTPLTPFTLLCNPLPLSPS